MKEYRLDIEMLLHRMDDPRFSGDPKIPCSGVAIDSRMVEPGFLFAAVPGFRRDGAEYFGDARARGAAAVLCSPGAVLLGDLPADFPVIRCADVRRAASLAAALLYDFPHKRLLTLGVTGTNGKSTVLATTRSILAAAGRKTVAVGTMGYEIPGEIKPAALTTPEAPVLQRLLAEGADRDADAAILEASSHSIALSRVADVEFESAAFTNLTRDHLDFHGTLESYKEVKFSLFRQVSGPVVTCLDDPAGRELAGHYPTKALTYGFNPDADIRPVGISPGREKVEFTVEAPGCRFETSLRLHGDFNILNALAAAGLALAAGVEPEVVARGTAAVEPVAGRMEKVTEADGVDFWVDFAHTPDAVSSALAALTTVPGAAGNLIAVFGCGGDRDRGKRPEMAAAVAANAAYAVVTSDNPRTEDPDLIIRDTLAGLPRGYTHHVEPDREKAIRFAAGIAGPGDRVVILGKGHETYQEIGDKKVPFDDREKIRSAVKARQPTGGGSDEKDSRGG